MKTFFRSLSLWAVLCSLAVGWVGCGKKQSASNGSAPTMSVADAMQALKAEDPAKRADAAVALGAHGEKAAQAVTALIEALKDEDLEFRRLAAYALGEIGPKASAAVPALKELMKDADRNMYTTLVNALRNIDPKSMSEKVVNTSEGQK